MSNEAHIRDLKEVVKALDYEEQIAVAEVLKVDVIAQVMSMKLVKLDAEVQALKEFAKKL